MKTFVATVVTVAMLTGPAYAQMGKGNPSPDNSKQQEKAAKAEKERAAIEKEYNDTMARTRSNAPPPKTDPWARVRPADSVDTKR